MKVVYTVLSIFTLIGGIFFWLGLNLALTEGFTQDIGLLIGVGAITASIGLIGLLYFIRRKRLFAHLRREGQLVQAAYLYVKPGALQVNRKASFVVVCQWQNPVDQQVYIFKSDFLFFNPEGDLRKAQKINVYIDPADPRKYAVDTDFLNPF